MIADILILTLVIGYCNVSRLPQTQEQKEQQTDGMCRMRQMFQLFPDRDW